MPRDAETFIKRIARPRLGSRVLRVVPEAKRYVRLRYQSRTGRLRIDALKAQIGIRRALAVEGRRMTLSNRTFAEGEHYRTVIVGTGFAGIGMAARLKQAGYDDFLLLERAAAVGGVWRDNTYPGCQCDVPSHLYSFSFALKHDWSRYYGLQREIREYLEACADAFGVRPHIRFRSSVLGARWDEGARCWHIRTSCGDVTADVLISATGGLAEPAEPDLPGIDRFEGPTFHSSTWRHDVDLTGKRVAVVGTGASAVQFVPAIQPTVGRLTVFQRTPPWIVPRMDRDITQSTQARYQRFPALQRLVRLGIYWSREALAPGFSRWPLLMRYPRYLAEKHLKTQVPDPALRAKLTPNYTIGCKRILLSDDWYPTLQQPNVDLVVDRIVDVDRTSIRTENGKVTDVDAIVFGTGFQVTTNPAFDLYLGRDGRSLGDHWRAEGMTAYKGTTVAGFPNLFLLIGPNTGLGHSSMVVMMESQFAYVLDALRAMDARGLDAVEPRPDVQAAYNAKLQTKLARSVWNSGGCASWYLDAKGNNPTLWPGGTWVFRLATRRFDAAAYTLSARTPSGATPPRRRQPPLADELPESANSA